jgi:hypothetical protein
MTAHPPGEEFRSRIVAELDRQSRSRYWLARVVAQDERADVSADAVYRYLRGESDTSGAVIAACCRALGIREVAVE